jgi:methanogenic corrinoid protein MtbC1
MNVLPMSKMNPKDQLIRLVADLEEDAVLELVKGRLAAGEDPMNIIRD